MIKSAGGQQDGVRPIWRGSATRPQLLQPGGARPSIKKSQKRRCHPQISQILKAANQSKFF